MPKKVEQKQGVGLATLAAIADGRQLLPEVKGTFEPRGKQYPLQTSEEELQIPMLAWQSRVLDALYSGNRIFGFVFDRNALTLISLTNYSASPIQGHFESEMIFIKEIEDGRVELKFSQAIVVSTVHYYVEITVRDANGHMLGWNTATGSSDSTHRPPADFDGLTRSIIADNLVRFGLIL